MAVNPQMNTMPCIWRCAERLLFGILQEINRKNAEQNVRDPNGKQRRDARFFGHHAKYFVKENKRERHNDAYGKVHSHTAAPLHCRNRDRYDREDECRDRRCVFFVEHDQVCADIGRTTVALFVDKVAELGHRHCLGNIVHGRKIVEVKLENGVLLFAALQNIIERPNFPLAVIVQSIRAVLRHPLNPVGGDLEIELVALELFERKVKGHFRNGVEMAHIYIFVGIDLPKNIGAHPRFVSAAGAKVCRSKIVEALARLWNNIETHQQ